MGAVYAALDRLESKGLLQSSVGEPTPVQAEAQAPLHGDAARDADAARGAAGA